VLAQAADTIGREGKPSRGLAALSIEDSRDGVIRVMDGQAANEINGVLVGAHHGVPRMP